MIVLVGQEIIFGHIKVEMPIRCPSWRYKVVSWTQKPGIHGTMKNGESNIIESNVNMGIDSIQMAVEAIRPDGIT